MVLRNILHYFANNEYVVDKLAKSKLFRRTAQLIVYNLHQKRLSNFRQKLSSHPKQLSQQICDVFKRFSENLQKEIEQSKQSSKK